MAIRLLYFLTTFLLVAGAIVMIVLPLRTYARTNRIAMIHLSMGFGLICAAAVATAISVRLLALHSADGVLIIHNGMTASGIFLVIYSLLTYN